MHTKIETEREKQCGYKNQQFMVTVSINISSFLYWVKKKRDRWQNESGPWCLSDDSMPVTPSAYIHVCAYADNVTVSAITLAECVNLSVLPAQAIGRLSYLSGAGFLFNRRTPLK